jgi:hypothetical protein
MKKSKIAQTMLVNLKVDPTEERLFVVETLIKDKKVKRTTLINWLMQKSLTDYQARMLLQSLNQKKVIRWTVESGVATVRLTKEAEAEMYAIEFNLFKEKAGVEFKKKIEDFEKGMDEFISSAKEGGDQLANHLADHLSRFADFLRKSKNSNK